MLVELLRPAGPDLARRLVAALLLAPVDERERIVEAIESRMVELYAPGAGTSDHSSDGAQAETPDEPRMMNVIDPPVQRDGFVEQKIHTYEVAEGAKAPDRSAKAG